MIDDGLEWEEDPSDETCDGCGKTHVHGEPCPPDEKFSTAELPASLVLALARVEAEASTRMDRDETIDVGPATVARKFSSAGLANGQRILDQSERIAEERALSRKRTAVRKSLQEHGYQRTGYSPDHGDLHYTETWTGPLGSVLIEWQGR